MVKNIGFTLGRDGLTALLLSALLTACGGGGDSGGTKNSVGSPSSDNSSPVVPVPPVAPTPGPTEPLPLPTTAPYTLSPSIIQSRYVAGFPTSIELTAKQTVPFVGVAYIRVTADQDVFDFPISIAPNADGTFTVKLNTSSSTPKGTYKGNLTINVCTDVACKNHLEGSPFKLPYVVEVISPEGSVDVYNLSVLKPLEGAREWQTVQSDAHHTGFVPVTLNPSAFNLRWRWYAHSVDGRQDSASALATGGGRFYVSFGPMWNAGPGHQLKAFNEHDGSLGWTKSFDNLAEATTNPPAYADGKVFIVAGSQTSTAMFALNASNGVELFKSKMSSQWEHYLAPTVVNGVVYTNGGTYGGMFAFDTKTGDQKFFTSLPQFDSWTPAVDDSYAYAYMNGALHIVDIKTGVLVSNIADSSYSWNGYSTHGAPVIGAPGSVLAGNSQPYAWASNALVNFDVTKGGVRWQAIGSYFAQPAYSQGEFFLANDKPTILEARREADGKVLWSWTPPANESQFVGNIVVTNNLVFVSTNVATYAIDRLTHATKWRIEESGSLAISASGLLYINSGSKIVAVNLH